MKYLYFFIFAFTLLLSCKQEKSTCQNGYYDQGEIGIDCGGICPDCDFDKNNILDKAWIDVDTSTHLAEHSFNEIDNYMYYHWTIPSFGSILVSQWDWVNESDTLSFSFIDSYSGELVSTKRKVVYINEGAYKFKTDIDNWEVIYSAILFE